MNILFVGSLGVGQTSRMRMETLRGHGHRVVELDTQALWDRLPRPLRWIEQGLHRGPTIRGLNRELLRLARRERPALVWAEKQEYVHPDTLHELRALGVRSLHFTPDPYFSLSWKRTPLTERCLPLYDVVLHCKSYEDAAYRRSCRRVVYMPLGFDESVHRPGAPDDPGLRRRFESEVGFVGGWEPRRERMLAKIATTGARLKIWGYAWDHLVDGRPSLRRYVRLRRLAGGEPFSLARNAALADAIQGGEVYAHEYAWALSGAAIGVGFLRTICADQHTTRTFEIPACGSMLLADRTDEHRALFEEGVEAEFFGSDEELLDKLRHYLARPDARARVAQAGLSRSHRSGYAYRDRVGAVLQAIGDLVA